MSWRVTGGPGMSSGPLAASPFTKIANWRPAISGQSGPCGSGCVMSALNTMMSVALTAAPMLPSAAALSGRREPGEKYQLARATVRAA